MPDLPLAEDVNYWKTGSSSEDTWLDKAQRLIEDLGGAVYGKAIGMLNGQGAVTLKFRLAGDDYRILWPVLLTRDGERDTRAARVQAATTVYHDVKAKTMVAKVIGQRAAFVGNLLTDQGITVAQYFDSQQRHLALPNLLGDPAPDEPKKRLATRDLVEQDGG